MQWTQEDLSRRSGVPVATISRWENQQVGNYNGAVLAKLARAFRVEVGFLLTLPE